MSAAGRGPLRLLLLAGTTEAREIAAALAREPRVRAVASLAGATRSPAALGIVTRVGGFGGPDGFARWLREARVDAVLDATHPFAAAMSLRSHAICAVQDVAYAQLLRPEWRPGPGDDWTMLGREEEAAFKIPPDAVVFLATGRQHLERFAGIADCTLWARQIDNAPATFPFPRGGWIVGRPPFSVEDEVALFRRLGVEWLVVKNAGGDASRAKLDAARRLGLRVAMIRRPPRPDALCLDDVDAALAWVRDVDARRIAGRDE